MLLTAALGCADAAGPEILPYAVTVTPDSLTLERGATVALSAAVHDAAGAPYPGPPLVWTSSDTLAATVAPNGAVTGRALGVALIRAASGAAADTTVVHVATPAASITLTPVRATVLAGRTLTLTALVRDSAGTVITALSLTWSSADTAVATVSAEGVVRGVAPGQTTVVAASATTAAAATIEVVPPVDSIVVAPGEATTVPDAQLTMRATLLDVGGDTLADRPVAWASSDTTVATVSTVGVVATRGPGVAAITATTEGRAASAALTVRRVRFTQVAAGHLYHTCGIATDSVAFCWGRNAAGEAGNGDPPYDVGPWARSVAGGLRFAALSAGEAFTCGITASGVAYCWGYAAQFRLGTGSQQPVRQFAPIAVAGGITFAPIIASGHSHSCALTPAGDAYCWGDNAFGDLGTGVDGPGVGATPQAVTGGLTFRDIGAGQSQTCGLTVDSVAYCWGQGPWLGTGDTTNRNTPAPVAGGLTFATLSTGGNHACGVTAAGVAYCWGDNGGGALGDSTTIDRLTPVPVGGGFAWRVVAAAGNHGTDYTCGLTTNGVAYCWGSHVGGNNVTPVPVPGAPAFASITLGGVAHACGITPGGVTYCWGENYGGALGDGSTTSSPTPVRVAGQP